MAWRNSAKQPRNLGLFDFGPTRPAEGKLFQNCSDVGAQIRSAQPVRLLPGALHIEHLFIRRISHGFRSETKREKGDIRH